MPTPETIRLRDPDGAIKDVDVRTAATVLQDSRWSVATAEDETGRVAEQAREVNYGGAAGAVKAGLAGVARGVSLGGSDVLARALGGEDAAIALEGLRETNPGISAGFEVAGALAPALVTGGAALPAGAAARLGTGAARAAEGSLGRIGGAAVGGAVEGALFGAGQGVSELALSTDPITVERVASAISSNALYGAALGGPLGALGKGAEIGLKRAKGAVDTALERRAAKARSPSEAIDSGDLENLDVRQLRAAQKAELDEIAKAQAPEREGFANDMKAVREESKRRQVWNGAAGIPDRDVREIRQAYIEADKKIDRLLKERRGLAESPERALDPLRRQEQALQDLDELRSRYDTAFRDEVANARQTIRDEVRARDPKSLAWKHGNRGPFTDHGLDLAVEREIKLRYGDGGLEAPARPRRLGYLDQVPEELQANRDLQQSLAFLTKPPASERLTRIEEALEALAQPKAPSFGEAVLGAAAPFAGPIGVAAAAGNRVLGSFKKIADAATTRVGKAASSFLGIAGKAAEKATPYLPLLATKTLAAVRYAEDDEPRPRRPEGAPKEPRLHELYQQRTDEVKRQVHIAPDGSYQMRPAARQKMAAAFDGIRMADPILADRLEEQGARKIEYLASILPRLPDYGTIAVGPERRRVSELEMRAWARAAAALEDPLAVFDRAGSATESGKPVVGVTVEDAAAIKAVYPELLAEFTTAVARQLPTLRKTLPFTRRLGLSILTGVPVDPAMTPGILRQLQSMHETEPGTAGGTQPAMAKAQFGSVSRKPETDSATPAQRRQQGAA